MLDQYLIEYNNKRPHQGCGANGRTLVVVFIEGIEKEEQTQTKATKKAA